MFVKGILQFILFRACIRQVHHQAVWAHMMDIVVIHLDDLCLQYVYHWLFVMIISPSFQQTGILTCVDMVSNVVTPKATLAGTDRLSSQNETWRIFILICFTY